MLNIIASNNWKRPICFTSPQTSGIGITPYLRQEGMIYRLTSVRGQQQRTMDAMRSDSLLRTVFKTGNAQQKGVYFDEENRRHLLSIRQTYAFAAANLANMGKKQQALNLLQKAESLISPENLPYAMVSRYQAHNQTSVLYLEAAYRAGHMELAKKLRTALTKDLADQKKYYQYMRTSKPDFASAFDGDMQDVEQYEAMLENMENSFNPKPQIQELPKPADSGKRP